MSTLGPQGIAPKADHGEWELIGRDMIRTKVRRGDNGQPTGGQIIAQFWTSPTAEHARLMTAAPELLAALTEAEGGIREAVRIMDLMGRGGDARNLSIHGNNLRAAIAKAKGAAS